MGTLAHVFEECGLATVALSSVRGQAARLRPPRVLHCDFPLGRPLGRPGDTVFQHRVLRAAFSLLEAADGPVLVDFDETVEDESGTALSCQIPPRLNPNLPPAVDEAQALRPAYERRRQNVGRTALRGLQPADIPEAVAAFVRIAEGVTPEEAGVSDLFGVAADIRAFYEEAAMELAGHVPAARKAETWFYQQTETGRVLRQAQERLRESGAPRRLWKHLRPVTQP